MKKVLWTYDKYLTLTKTKKLTWWKLYVLFGNKLYCFEVELAFIIVHTCFKKWNDALALNFIFFQIKKRCQLKNKKCTEG